jgi:Asp-tRNA(Asn)/Glu-tRNA(Gln) amidotransferase A subunit family amidase
MRPGGRHVRVGAGRGLAFLCHSGAASHRPAIQPVDLVLRNGQLLVLHHGDKSVLVCFVELCEDRLRRAFLVDPDLSATLELTDFGPGIVSAEEGACREKNKKEPAHGLAFANTQLSLPSKINVAQMRLDRRTWLKLAPALAGVRANWSGAQTRTRPQEAPQRVTREMLHQALGVIGLEFSAEQEAMMLPSVNRNFARYEALRKIEVPLDTEPAIRFVPRLPGVRAPTGPARFKLSREAAAPRKRSWNSLEELAFLTLTELAALVRARQVSPVELTQMYLARLKRYSPKLNCVITLTEDLATEQAERAAREIRSGKYRGPLHGIPYGVKDLFATKGIRTTWGAEPFQNQVFDYDATVVERLEKAGAVLLGKLSMGALAQGGLWFGGMTRNPWNIEQSSSGSSAGSAAATAAGLVGFAIGTETLGSIVSPCIVCGTAGLRPTYGRVSRFGAMGLSWTMDKVGPICRSVEDCALVLNAIHGPDGHDETVADMPFDWTPDLPIDRLRIGYLKKDFDSVAAETKPVYEKALEDLKKAGANLEPAELPEFNAAPLRIILSAEAATAFDDLTRQGAVNQLRGQGPGDWPNTFRTSRLISAVEYIRAQRARTLLMRKMDETMSRWDVLVSPSGPSLLVTNLTGHPQVVVPCGATPKQRVGLLFTGRLYEEGAPLRVALAFERATEWHAMHPKMDWS